MKGISSKSRRKREKVIRALLEEDTLSGAAKVAGIGEATLWRMLQDKEFKEEYRKAKKQILDHAIGRLQHATGTAINAIISIVADEEAPPSARISGARTLLETAIKVAEIEDIEGRLERLEQRLKGGPK